MSLLLDALRKSERQRKLGQVPGIDVPSRHSETRPSSRYRWLLLALPMLALVGIGWWLLSDGDSVDARLEQNTATQNPDATERAEQSAAAMTASEAGPTAANNSDEPRQNSALAQQDPNSDFTVPSPRASLPTPTEQPSNADDGSANDGRRGALSRDLPTAMDTMPQSAASLDDLARLAAASTQTDTASSAGDDDATALAATTAAATVATTAKDGAPESAQVAQPTDENWRPGEPAPISYYELPVSVRQKLADFRVTIRIYNEDPRQRFVVIKQERFFEGDDVGDGLRLREIRRDGVVFEFDQYRFLLQ